MADRKNTRKKLKIATIAFQGEPGAFSDISCRTVFPGAKSVPCTTFEDTFSALAQGRVDAAMIPVENAIAGRVADVHHLIAQMDGLHIVAEHFQPIEFSLLGTKDSNIKSLTHVHSHVMALPQCRREIRRLNLREVVHADTAGAAAKVAQDQDPTQAALASELAGSIYGLKVLKKGVQNTSDNVTRFLVFTRKPAVPAPGTPTLTSLFIQGQNIPAYLFKILGAFATNEINMVNIQSYIDNFKAAQFYCEVEGHPAERRMKLALDEVGFYTKGQFRVMGAYPAHAFRAKAASLKK